MTEIAQISLISFMFCALGQDEGDVFHFYQKAIKRLPWYLGKPLGRCYVCFVGQTCFWFYLLNRIALNEYCFFEHLFYVFAGIFLSMIYHKLYCWLK